MTQPTPPADPAGPLAWLNDLADPVPPPDSAPQASDPGMFAGVVPIPRITTPAVGGGTFTVDLERAPEAIRELEGALTRLEELREDAQRLGRVTPPARDSVSRDAALMLQAVATGGPGSLLSALDAGSARLKNLLDAMRGDLANYRQVDDAVGVRLSDSRYA